MRYISIIAVLLMLAVWLVGAGRFVLSSRKKIGFRRLAVITGGFFMAVGALGFFGTFLLSMTDILPASFELPAGTTTGVVTMPNQLYLVPLTAPGRVQVYDRQWKFLRGWHVEAGGGTFQLFTSDTNRVHVVTARRQMHYTYDLNGHLLASEHYPPKSYADFPSQGTLEPVPTPTWLWPFTGPGRSWLTAAFGVCLLVAGGAIRPTFRKGLRH